MVLTSIFIMTRLLIHCMDSQRYLNGSILLHRSKHIPSSQLHFSLVYDVQDLGTARKVVEPLTEKLPTLASCSNIRLGNLRDLAQRIAILAMGLTLKSP